MDELDLRVLRRLVFRPESLSRNRNFDAFDDPDFRRIRRIARHLRSVVDELRYVPVRHVRVTADDDAWVVHIERPEQAATRDIRLQRHELELLAMHPACAALRVNR